MVRIPDARIDSLISEDIPYIDLTCEVLDIASQSGQMEYFTREDAVLAGSSVVRRIMSKLNCEVVSFVPDGQRISAGDTFMVVRGAAADLHMAWKVCLNMFDHLSAIATKTRAMVDAVHEANPMCEVVTTRKSMPGAKDIILGAVMAGGALPHRLGLSETVLVFESHLAFCGGTDAFIERLPEIKARCVEKKLFVEASVKDAPRLVRAGADGIQFDKVAPEVLTKLVGELRAINPYVTLIAAGGVNMNNAAAYAKTGVNALATTALYTAKPIDMSMHMRALCGKR